MEKTSNFLLMVQTGLLMHVVTTRVNQVWLDGDMGKNRKPLYTAMADATILENAAGSGIVAQTRGAEQFINWCLGKKEYGWIEQALGARKERPY